MSKMNKDEEGCAFIIGLAMILFAASFFIGLLNAAIVFTGIMGFLFVLAAIKN